jgi:hypothetical protein
MPSKKNSSTKLIISIALCISAMIASYAMSVAANHTEKFWVLLRPVASGTQLDSADVGIQSLALGSSSSLYLRQIDNPVGSITRRALSPGEILQKSSITEDSAYMDHQQMSISMRSVDIPSSIEIGEVVTLFQVHDSRNGETPEQPHHIASGVFITSIDRKGSNFGGDVAVTVSINRESIPDLLNATTSGRLVMVAPRG